MTIRNLTFLVFLSAFATSSCGDAVPPPPEGAVGITVSNSSSAIDASCNPPFAMNLTAGVEAPNLNTTGELLVNGHDGATVSCRVSGNGSYEISGSVRYQSNWLNISGNLNADGTGTASVSLWYQNGPGEILSDSNCTLKIGSGNYKVEAGALWASVSCSALKVPASSGNIWCAGNGTIVLKSCDD